MIRNKKNKILEEYVTFVKDYKQYYEKYFCRGGKWENKGSIQSSEIEKKVLDAIEKSKIIMHSNRKLYGFTN